MFEASAVLFSTSSAMNTRQKQNLASACGTVGNAVSSNTRDPQFESCH